MDAETLVDYAKSLDCIHCGLCLNTCPTYRLTGAEASSPRGRIHLMRAVAEGTLEPDHEYAEELDFCLLCRHCESVCPSGVQFGALMEHARSGIESVRPRGVGARLARWIGFRVLLPQRVALRAAAAIGRLAQRSGSLRALAPLFGARGRALLAAPKIPPRAERRRLDERTPAIGRPVGQVLVLEGCVMPELFGRVNRATVAVLAHAGFESRVPRAHVCCGSLHAHNGDLDGALVLARATIEAFDARGARGARKARGGDLPIVVNSAGCSAHMKDYGRLLGDDPRWGERARRFSARVQDLTEFLAREPARSRLEGALRVQGVSLDLGRVTYDDPCHLCHGQGIRKPPRALLDLVPGLERVELADSESCCGSAGIYSILRPQDSSAVFEAKRAALAASGARTLVTANPGCQMQWETGLARSKSDVCVLHVVEVLAAALGVGTVPRQGSSDSR